MRATSTTRRAFSTTRCREAKSAAPESANAPSAPTVSFWRSTTRSALAPGSIGVHAGAPAPIASSTSLQVATVETFWSAKLIDALCQSAFMVEQPFSATTMV